MKFKEEWSFLNEYQMEAVLDESPACVVNANVGSGKTTVLTAKIQYLHEEKQIPLEDMVVLTFTNKAAHEIKDRLRVKQLITNETEESEEKTVPGFGTFHSVAMHLLKEKLPVETTGWTAEFTVIDPDEETELAMELIAEQGLKVKYKNRLKKRLEQEYGAYLEGKENSRYKDELFVLYPLLEQAKKRQNKMSFSDLLSVSTELLRKVKQQNDCGKMTEEGKWHAPSWIIVDEVQDSDRQQLEFLKALKWEDTHLFAVGDPNQVIYSWRGTSDNMFFLLKHQFAAKELSLPVNYRSNASIIEAANRFLQYGTQIQGSREVAEKIIVRNYYDPFQEAEYLAERVKKLHDQEGISYDQIAVFYRLQKQAEIFEKVFEKHGIPYEVSAQKTPGESLNSSALYEMKTDMGEEKEILAKKEHGTIKCMTLHASKGLEFDTVFLTGVNQGLLPLNCKSYEQEEEERRLFFVGITRARNHLELSWYTNPGEPGVTGQPSRYLQMIPKHLLEREDQAGEQDRIKENWKNLQEIRKKVRTEIQKKEEQQKEVHHVKHPKYGTGILTGEDELIIEAEFEGYGKKQFLKAFGEAEILD